MFTSQMIAGSTQKEGTYHFFEMKGTALSLMVPNVGSKWKQKKDAVNTFKVSTTGRLVTFTTEIFGIPLMKHSPYALKHCLVDVEGDKRACYARKEAAIFAACIRGILEYPYKCGKTRNGVPTCDKICMMMTRLACNRAIESSYWRMDNNSDVGLLTGYVLYWLPIELEFMDLGTFSR
jgi:hypothetical protein